MKKALILAFTIVLMFSCKIEGLTNDFGKLTSEQKNLIVELKSFDSLNSNLIYKINASQLKQELKKHPKSIVYIFKNGCSSKLCKPMIVYENYAREHKYKLFLVMDGYADLNATYNQPHSSPLFSINNYYYNSNIRNNYGRYFENEISDKPMKERRKEYLGSLFFFENDKLIKVLYELP